MSSDPNNDKNLPPWLRGVPLPPKPRGAEERPAPPPAAQSGSGGEPAPDWLRSMSADRPTPAPAPELPPWLRDDADDAADSSAEQEALPDWLRDIQSERPAPPSPGLSAGAPPEKSEAAPLDWPPNTAGDAAPPAASSGAGSAEDALPDWLRATPPASESPRAPAELPSWLSDIMSSDDPPTPPAPETRAPGAAELPSWLSDITSSDAPQAPPAREARPPDAELPPWLSDITSSDAPQAPGQSTSESPSWLSELTQSPESPGSSDWLWEPTNTPVSPDAGATADAGPPAPEARGASDSRDTAQIPAWLLDEAMPPSVDNPPAPAEPAEAPADTDLSIPEWLRGAAPESEPEIVPFSFEETPAEPPSAGEPKLPGWLSGGAEEASEPSLPSWMQEQGGASPPAGGAGEQGRDETPPSWIQEPAAEETAPGPAAPEVPLWLQDLERDAAAQPPAEAQPLGPAQPEPAREADEDLPAWLRSSDLAPSPSEPAQPPAAEPPRMPPSEDVPAWLRELRPAAQAPGGAPDEDLPEWLRETAPAAESAPAEEPAWLSEAAALDDVDTQPGFGQPSEPAAPAPEEDDLPSWLRSSPPSAPSQPRAPQEMPPWLRDEVSQMPAEAGPGDAGLPAWLRGAPIDSPPPIQPPEPAPPPPASLDWLGDEAAPATPAGSSADAGGLVGGIELPAWLRPPEPEPAKEEISTADARSLDWLTRLGGQEEEEISAIAAPALKLAPPKPPTRTPAQIEALALLQRLAATPFPEGAAAPTEAAPPIWRRVGGERVLYLVMLAAIVIALIIPAPAWLGLSAPPTAPGAQALFDQIDRLGQNDIVLVGYEWDARRSGELRPLEQAVMDHLIQRKVKLVLVSTDPQGALLLFDLRDRLAAAGWRSGGEDYILLGYKPGAELALRSLAQDFYGALRSDFRGDDATVGLLVTDIATGKPRLRTLGDLAMILVLADEPSDVQGWMEQVRPSALKADGAPVPFGFLLPAETAPIAQPYLTMPSVYHLAAKQGALAYQQLRGGSGLPAEQITTQVTQQRLSALAYIALFAVGAIVVGIAAVVARRRA